jgi:hypothetical protein
MTEPADDMFASADTSAAILAFVFSEYGADGLKELLSLVEIDRESLERDAAELTAVDLPRPAEIVAEHAKQSQPAIELWNPYSEDDYANHSAWREGYVRRQGYNRSDRQPHAKCPRRPALQTRWRGSAMLTD